MEYIPCYWAEMPPLVDQWSSKGEPGCGLRQGLFGPVSLVLPSLWENLTPREDSPVGRSRWSVPLLEVHLNLKLLLGLGYFTLQCSQGPGPSSWDWEPHPLQTSLLRLPLLRESAHSPLQCSQLSLFTAPVGGVVSRWITLLHKVPCVPGLPPHPGHLPKGRDSPGCFELVPRLSISPLLES